MKGFYSPINALAEQMTRPKGTGAEFMTELSKKPGFKQAEVEDRNLQALQSMPKMAREDFIANLKAQRPAMPKERVFRNDPKDLTYEEDYDKQYHGVTGEPYHEEHTLPGGTNYREILLQHPHGSFPGVGAHFGGAPNVLASMRVKDRTGPEGKKILHIEEIQSDWHKKGSKKGYAPIGEDLHDTAKQAERAYNQLQAKRKEASAGAATWESKHKEAGSEHQHDMAKRMLDKYNSDVMGLTPQVTKAEEAHRVAKERAHSAVPDAPFKKNWHELALKRMIQHAVESGHDEIHITPGATQAERWGASGEGAKGFHDLYDKQIPQFLNKFGKQFGAQVQPGSVSTINQTKRTPQPDTPENQWGDVANQPMGEAEQLAHMPPSTHPTHSFPITPEMREHVIKNGMPLYAKGGEVDRTEGLRKFLDTSKVKNRMYHGTHSDIEQFKPTRSGIFLSPKASFSNDYATAKGGNVMPVHVQVSNPFDFENEQHVANLREKAHKRFPGNMTVQNALDSLDSMNNWSELEHPDIQKLIKSSGHDAYYVNEDGTKNLGVYDPRRIKSAIGNRGTYDTNEPDITKAKGGAVSRETIKPIAHGIIKERVTVSPNLDAMQYELMSAKRFTKKVK